MVRKEKKNKKNVGYHVFAFPTMYDSFLGVSKKKGTSIMFNLPGIHATLLVGNNFYLTHSHTMTLLTPLGNKPFENTVGKGEIARNEQFLPFPQCFLPVWITFFHFREI